MSVTRDYSRKCESPVLRPKAVEENWRPLSALQAPNSKGSINLRIEDRTRRLIDNAAAVLGKTRTDFMIESARRHAIDVLLDQQLFVLDARRHDAFMRALDDAPAPEPSARSLLRRAPAWQR